jgi:hypothetical protein
VESVRLSIIPNMALLREIAISALHRERGDAGRGFAV